ncbi:hypothetical protein AYO44_04675 [Planctomycetaceae bacterium SCGC AG-212-F19]|nr:hypothetical protein AYO44_04675 [Planctomycetaceae bacterium SCGC AG-212-F19]
MKTMNRAALGLAIVLACAADLRADEAEARALRTVTKFGGHVRRDEKVNGRPVVTVSISDTKFTDADVKDLAGFPELVNLFLSRTGVGDVGLISQLRFQGACHESVWISGGGGQLTAEHLNGLDSQ